MKSVIVSYQVKPEFAVRNAENIRAVMEEIRQWNDDGIRYQSFTKEDGVSFVHFGMYKDEASVKRMSESEAFKKFQSELRSSEPVKGPEPQWLDFVASMYDIF